MLTALGYFVYPGHTYLQADTQIYVPMMERIYNPVLFFNDPMIQRPHLALTAYDEIATALRNYAGLNFEYGLKLQQILFRACAAAGLLLTALRLGLSPPGAFLTAGLVILNVSALGMGITELDPVARSFALGLGLLAVGLAVNDHPLAAGLAAGLGFLIHPTTMAPFWAAAAFVVLRRTARPILLAPLPVAGALMLLLMHYQAGGTEPLEFWGTVAPFQEALQRRYMGINFVSEWRPKAILDCVFECTVVAVGLWRIGMWGGSRPRRRLSDDAILAAHGPAPQRLQPAVRDWLWALAIAGVLSIPFSWIVLDRLHWSMAGPWVPVRALVLVAFLAALLSAACGVFAAQKRLWWEAPAWFGIGLALPVKDALVTWYVNPWLIVLVLALTAATTVAGWVQDRTRGISLIVAGLLPFVALPASGLVRPPKPVDSRELKELAAWAKATTDESAVFLFADEGRYGGSGPFRARALRSVYVDYEGRALVNYYPQFSAVWYKRWTDVHEGFWLVAPEDFQKLAEWRVDFVVLRKEHEIPAKQADFSNSHYVVYRVLPTF